MRARRFGTRNCALVMTKNSANSTMCA
jgi:hypothetical protein